MTEIATYTYDMAKRAYSYCPDTGDLTMLRGPAAGKVVMGRDMQGYVRAVVRLPSGKKAMAYGHRLAFLLMTGEWPERGLHVDHINREKADNRWENLRLTTPRQNFRNNSGMNVTKVPGRGWAADVRVQFDTKAEAEALAADINTFVDGWLSTNGYFHKEEDAA